jgi:hypothetical protein
MWFCVQREGAAHLRDRLTLLVRLYSRNCDYLMFRISLLRHTFQSGKVADSDIYSFPDAKEDSDVRIRC